MPEMHLEQPGFTYSASGPFTKNKERIQKFKETGDTNYIYKNEIDKPCFQHDMTYGDFKNLARRRASDKVLRDKAFNIAKDPKYNGYQRRLAAMVYKSLIKSLHVVVLIHIQIMSALWTWLALQKLAEELHKLIIRKFKKEQFILDSKTTFGVLI